MKILSIAVVTYNNVKVIQDCLDSLLSQQGNHQVSIVVIDNTSSDGTLNILHSYAQNGCITLLQNSHNAGFGAAHNIAINRTDSDYHILCNPDIVINAKTLNVLAAYMDKHPDIGILCPRLVNGDGSLQANNHRYPTIFDLALRRFAPACLKKRFAARMDAYLMLDVGYGQSCEVPFVSGAFMFCRTAALKKVVGFDERYFLYFEDVDLCRKMHQAGYRTVYNPDAEAVHQWERAAYKSWCMAWVMMVSAGKYFNKWGYRFI